MEKANSFKMFDSIASTYDRINRILSGGIDLWWRKQMTHHLPKREKLRLLDLATGTCDQMISLMDRNTNICSATGLDPSKNMLKVGERKLQKKSYSEKVDLLHADALAIPLKSSSVDVTSMSFGIRNVPDVPLSLQEMHRVLTKGGKSLILEFSLPSNRLFRRLYLFYLRHILPKLGKLLSSHPEAYSYLNKTIETFPSGNDFCNLMKDAGFLEVEARPMTFGIATLYSGTKL